MSLASFVLSVVFKTRRSELMLHKGFIFGPLASCVNSFNTVSVIPVSWSVAKVSSHAVAVTRV